MLCIYDNLLAKEQGTYEFELCVLPFGNFLVEQHALQTQRWCLTSNTVTTSSSARWHNQPQRVSGFRATYSSTYNCTCMAVYMPSLCSTPSDPCWPSLQVCQHLLSCGCGYSRWYGANTCGSRGGHSHLGASVSSLHHPRQTFHSCQI